METITIDASNFIAGESKTPFTNEGGFSPTSYGLSPAIHADMGRMYAQDSVVDNSNDIDNVIIATFYDPDAQLIGGEDLFAVDEDGKYYTFDAGSFTKQHTGTGNYQTGTTDLVVHKSSGGEYIFCTQKNDIARLTAGMGALDEDWWTNTEGHGALDNDARHPMEVVEDTLYVADAYNLHTYDGTTSVNNAMTLPRSINITALIKHPDGRHLIAFAGLTSNYGHSAPTAGKAYIIDTVTLEFIREVDLDSQVEGVRNVGGILYVTYGNKLGYFDGDKLQFLKLLTPSREVYKPKLANIEGTLVIADGKDVLLYGDLIGNGTKVFYRIYRDATHNISFVDYYGRDTIIFGSEDDSTQERILLRIDTQDAGGQGKFYGNRYRFSSKVWIRRIEIEHEQNNDENIYFDIGHLDEQDAETVIKELRYADANNNCPSRTRVDCNILTSMFAPIFEWQGTYGFWWSKIVIYYEPGE